LKHAARRRRLTLPRGAALYMSNRSN